MAFNINFYNNPAVVNQGQTQSGDTEQIVNITDLICEGPIKGLVKEEAGLYLNDSPAIDADFEGSYSRDDISSGVPPTITFDGSTNVGTNSEGLGISNTTDVENRAIQIEDYQSASVGVSFVPTGPLYISAVTINWTNGSFSEADWNTVNKINRRAILKASGYEISGSFTVQNATTGTFVYYGDLSDSGFDTSKQHTLNIAQTFFLESVAENSQSLTLKDNAVPTAGTYNFKLLTAGLVESGTYIPGSWGNYKKVDKLNVQFVDGSLYQNSLAEFNGVGGAVSISGNPQNINLPELKQLQKQVAAQPSLGITLIDPDDYPESQTSNENGAAGLTILTTTSFGLDSAAKISQVDEVNFTITYPSFQTFYLKKGRKETAYAYYEMKIFVDNDDGNGISNDWADGINIFSNYGKYIIHRGNTNAPVAFQHTVGLDQFRPFTNFEIRIARITRHVGLCVRADGTSENFTERDDWQLAAQASISALGGVIKDKFRYPYSAVASVTFSSKKYNGVPKRSYLLEGLKVKIPDTYTPREYSADGTATYEGFWGGGFKDELYYTDNPAWVFYDIVTNNRYGAGQWIKEADINKYALYRIAKYCDELVPDGKGGTEPRFRANLYLSKSTDIYKVLKDIASMFTGMLYWLDGQLTVIQDTPADAVYTFSKSNVIDGRFNYESTGTKTRANQVVVTWNDPTINYEPVPLIVEDREDIVRKGRIISETAVAFGATSEGQAIRYGRWKLWTALNQTEIVSFKTGIAGAYIKPGDIINVQDADRYGISHSGRISSYAPGTLVLDRNVTFNVGATYTLSTLVTEPAAFYAGYETITIGGTTINRGDRIVEAYVNSSTLEDLNTEELASNAYQDPGRTEPLEITWKEYTYIQTQEITNPETTTNTLSITTDVAVEPQTIWALTEESDSLNAADSIKKYKVLSLSKDSQIEYNISAVEYYDAKFDAVDTDYELGQIPSSVYTELEPEQVPAPRNIYVVLETDAKRPGEELRVEWDAPEDFDYISGYELLHTVEGIDSPIAVNSTSYSFKDLPNDLYTFRVRTVSTKGNKSRYLSVNYNVSDPFENNVTRLQEGIPAGIRGSSTLVVNSNNQLGFEVDPTTVVSVGDEITTARTIDSDDNISLVGVQSTPNVDYSVILLGSTIELAYYESAALENLDYWKRIPDGGTYLSSQSNNWSNITGSVSVPARSNRVTGVGTTWRTTLNPRDILLFGSATDLVPYAITAVENGKFKFRAPTDNLFTVKSRVRIDGTSGSTQLNGNYYYINNITSVEVIVEEETIGFDYTLSLYSDANANTDSVSVAAWTSGGTIRNSPPAAKVISIISDTEILIDKSFEKEIPSSTSIKKRWGLNPSAHSIFGTIKYSSIDEDFELKKNIILDPSLVISRFLSISTSVPALQYEQVSGTVSQIQIPSTLSITVNPIGFKDPVFKVTAVSAGLEGAIVDTEWQDPTSGFQYTKEVDIDGIVAYGTGQVEQVTVLVAERYNTTDYIEDYGFFVKLKDGAIGIDGKTVRLTADDYSVIYDSQGENPSYTDSNTQSNITLTATANFENPLYRFTEAGGTPGAWSTTATFNYTVPLTFPDWANKTRVFEVEAADTPSGWDQNSQTPTPTLSASDSLTIAAVKSGAGGVALVNSNSTHSYSTNANGVITTSTIPNSGTTLELLVGGTVGTYVGATSGAAFGPSGTTLSNGQWYISNVTDTDTDISAGNITGVSNNIVTIAPVNVSQPDPVIDDNESITWTITYKSEGQEQSIITTQTLSKSKTGADGVDGANGADGATGPTGATGANGDDGLSGFFYVSTLAELQALPAVAGQVGIVTGGAEDVGYIYNGTTWVAQAFIDTGIIVANAIGAAQLEISANSSGQNGSIYMDGANNRIEIFDTTGALRVKLGNLA
jgi:predicted phage tail protein